MFGFLLKFLSSCVSFQYPVYASYKALKSRDQDALVPWLVYWVVVSVVTAVETWFGFLFVWLPLYQFARFGFMLWLVMPHSQGANYVYYTYIEPAISSHEQEIETLVGTAQDKAKTGGLELLNTSIEYIKCIVVAMIIGDKNVDVKANDEGLQGIQSKLSATTDGNGTIPSSTTSGSSIYRRIWSIGNNVFNAAYQTSVDIVASPTGAGVLGGAAAGVPSADVIATMFGNAAATFVESAATAAATASGGAIDMELTQPSAGAGDANEKSQGDFGISTSYYSRGLALVSRLWARKSTVSSTASTKEIDGSRSLETDSEENVSHSPPPQPAKSWPGQFVTAPQEGTVVDETSISNAGESIRDLEVSTTPEGKNVEWVII